MLKIYSSEAISDVKLVDLQKHSDDRGAFMETFRTEWFPEREWTVVQTNRSDSQTGVLRGLHYHKEQVDYWHVATGSVRVALADLRRSSPTYQAIQVIELNQIAPMGLFIPQGVAHGFLALTRATLLYVVDNYYNGGDEYGVAWDDATLAIEWGIQMPLLSERDRLNPQLSALSAADLPE